MGKLEHASTARPSARILINAIWFEFHSFFQQQHAIIKRRLSSSLLWLKAPLDWDTASNTHKLLIDKLKMGEVGRRLYSLKRDFKHTPLLQSTLSMIHKLLSDTSTPWSISIGHIIDRTPFAETGSDSCTGYGCGGFSAHLQFWYGLTWSDQILRRTKLNSKHPEYIHINALEFVGSIISLAAVITRLHDLSKAPLPQHIINSLPLRLIPPNPSLQLTFDNTPTTSWATTLRAKSHNALPLVELLAALLDSTSIGIHPVYNPGVNHVIPDRISRYKQFYSPDQSLFHSQVEQIDKRLTSFDIFLPSQDLLSLLSSRLLAHSPLGLPSIPEKLGRFAPASSITYGFVEI